MNEMNKVRHLLLLVFAIASVNLYAQKTPVSERIIDFDRNWKFKTGEYSDAVHLSFDDSDWRMVDLPHDWSIEELPGQEPGKVIGPFSVESPGGPSTGNVMGGIAWYRKIFTLPVNKRFSRTIINFDGVYMDCDIWVNGKKAGTHPYGYTAFDLDITDYLNRGNKPNIIAVNVRNEGKNTRWYSGSGIYRHVWMIRKEPVHIINNGVFITTEGLSSSGAEIKIAATVNNTTAQPIISLLERIIKIPRHNDTASPSGRFFRPRKISGQRISYYKITGITAGIVTGYLENNFIVPHSIITKDIIVVRL